MHNLKPKATLLFLAKSLQKLSVTKISKASQFFQKDKTNTTLPTEAILDYLLDTQSNSLHKMINYSIATNSTPHNPYLMINPFYGCLDDVYRFYHHAIQYNPFFSSLENKSEYNHRINACLIYLHQKLTHQPIKEQSKKFYRVIEARNNSIKQLMNYPSEQNIFYSEYCFTLQAIQVTTMDGLFQEMVHYRNAILTHLRNHFKDQDSLKLCKYLWRITNGPNQDLIFTLYIISNSELAIFSEFRKIWLDKLQNYLQEQDWDNLKLAECLPGPIKTNKTKLQNQLLEQPIFITIDPQGHKKSVFGLGGLGGRKYKE